MAFHPGQLLVFDRAGTRVGVVEGWSVNTPRSHALNSIEDFGITIPLLNQDGSPLYTTAMAALFARDNLVYIADEMAGLAGWGGAVDNVLEGDNAAAVHFLGGMSLLNALQTDRITQSAGTASTVAQRLISAANAKKGPHGDLQIGFVVDGSSPLYGTYDYTGDVYNGLSTLASDTLSEFWGEWVLAPGGTSLSFVVHWDRLVVHDHSDIILTDGGSSPNLKSGSRFLYSGLETLNRIRLKGVPTHLADYLDYDCIKSVVRDVSPIVDYELPTALPTQRLREDLSLTVNFGLSDNMQKQIATTGYDDPVTGDHIPGIQDTYLGYYKTFLYAYHNWQGKPFLEGYDWSGPDGTNDKLLTESYYYTWNKLGRARGTTVVTSETDGALPNAVIDEWTLDVTINPVDAGAVGVALDWGTGSGHWIAKGTTGDLYLLAGDNATTTLWGNVTGGGETLLSVASDPGSINQVWVLVKSGAVYYVRSYDTETNVLLTSYVLSPTGSPNDIAVDFAAGLLYVAGTADATIRVYDINSGSVISPDPSFSSGSSATNIGVSVTGGIAYVLTSTGEVRMLFVKTGGFAGTFSTGLTGCKAIYADFTNRRIWVVLSTGAISIYHAYVAVGVVSDAGSVSGAPGFDSLMSGRMVHIVMSNSELHKPTTASAAGASTTYTVKSSDSLWTIALHFYGAGTLWRTIYNANRSLIGSNPSLIFPGQHLVIPGKTQTVPPLTATKYLIVFTDGRWVQTTVPGPIGQPDQLQRVWDMDQQIVGFIAEGSIKGGVVATDPAVVIVGEEGRVCDWNPTLDGYGLLKTNQQWRTKTGHIIATGHGWYPQQWDVPDRAFEPAPEPYWPEGRAYAHDYLNHKNREVTVQQLVVTNTDGLWGKIELGGIYTVHNANQGPRPSGISIVVRVLKFSPNDVTGELELIAELYIPDSTAPNPLSETS
jgi:LysM repeat protein